MSSTLTPDVCVIGAGSAGLTVAAAARAVGLSVVLIERDRMGGECLNTGCVPSKALIAAARHAHAIRRAAAFGVDAGEPRIEFSRVHAHVHAVIGAIAPHDSQERFEGLGATVIRAAARFVDERTVEAGGRIVRARRFVVASGSRPVVPPIPGLDGLPCMTNESVFDLTALPDRLLVIGGGPIGLELAQAFRRLGSDVTVVQKGRALGNDDPEMTAIVLSRLRAEGVTIIEHAEVVRAEADGAGIALLVAEAGGERRLSGSHLLVAAGRRPATDGLGLDAAHITHDGRGIETDAAMRTTNRRVYAIGDVGRSFRFTHWAGYQGGLVVRSILTGWPHRERRDAIAWATYTDPELAHVGLSEAQARDQFGNKVRVHRWPYAGNDRAQADLETEGLVKVIAGPRGRVLGAEVAGAGAGEIAALFAHAIAGKTGLSTLAGMIVPYPTLAELTKRAAMASYAAKLKAPAAGHVLTLLRAFSRMMG